MVRACQFWDGVIGECSGRGSMMAISFVDAGGWRYAGLEIWSVAGG